MFKKCNERCSKRSSAFQGLEELKLGPVTRYKISQKALTNEQLVKIGRDRFFHKGINGIHKSWADSLASALDKAGYIRHDINDRTFLVGELYRRIYVLNGKDTSAIFTKYGQLETNQLYESCQCVTDDWYYHMMRFLETHLTEQESMLLKLRFGLQDGSPLTEGQIARLYGLLSPVVRHEVRTTLIKIDKAGIPALDY